MRQHLDHAPNDDVCGEAPRQHKFVSGDDQERGQNDADDEQHS